MKHITFAILLALSAIVAYGQDYYPAKKDGQWGFNNASGTNIIKYQFDDALRFSQDLAAVKKGTKWGYIDQAGAVIIDFKYDGAWYFTEGLAAVRKLGQWGYINKSGETVVDFKYDQAGDFSQGLAWVERFGKVGFIDAKGTVQIDFLFGAAGSFEEGLAPAQKNGKWGYISKIGALRINYQFEEAKPFDGELAAVKLAGKWGFVDQRGELIINFESTTLKDVYRDLSFGWTYAKSAYAKSKGADESSKSRYHKHLKAGVALIESKGSYFSLDELKLLKSYYEELKDDVATERYKQLIKEKKKSGRSGNKINLSRSSGDFTSDLSVAVAPFKFMFKNLKQKPLYAELRLKKVSFGVRYDIYDGYKDKFRFGAWTGDSNDDTQESANRYSGTEISGFIKFFDGDDIEKGAWGYGYDGGYWGFEYRHADFEFDPIITEFTFAETGFTPIGAEPMVISPLVQTHDICVNFGYQYSKALFFIDMGMSVGIGFKVIDLGEGVDFDTYEFSDVRLDKKRWDGAMGNAYIPFRLHFRAGINIW